MPTGTADCEFADQPHTLWLWDTRGEEHLPVPVSAHFDNYADAQERFERLTTTQPAWLSWVKVFRSDNESYECLHWERPRPISTPRSAEGRPHMEVTLGGQRLFGPGGKLSIDNDMLRIVQNGVLEEIAYADIVEVKVHALRSKVTIRTNDRERTLAMPTLWRNKHRLKKVAAEIERRRSEAATIHKG